MPKHTSRATCRLTAFGEAVLRFPYSAGLVDDLKREIPYRYRTYDPASKAWTIEPDYADLAVALLLRFFPDAEVPARWHYRSPAWEPPDAASEPFRVLHLRETAPVELIESAFRVMARLHHPDHGGDVRAMQAVNAAYAALKARVPA